MSAPPGTTAELSSPPVARRGVVRAPTAPPLYHQVSLGIEEIALSPALDDEAPLPAEGQLMARFGVSRGTVRRATEELVRSGLLRSEPGRGTYVNKSEQVRRIVRRRLVQVALPDSRFHLDVKEFVPDFDGSSACIDAVRALPDYVSARTVFAAPDNSLEMLRRVALDDGKDILVPTYAMRRGFVRLSPNAVPDRDRFMAATLDGMERFGDVLDLPALRRCPPMDLLVTGATAVTQQGVHVGGGQAYFDLEWALLAELGLVRQSTPIVAVVHPCQVVPGRLRPGPYDVTVDLVVTPESVESTNRGYPRPEGISWRSLEPDLFNLIPYFGPLLAQRQRRSSRRSRA